MCTIAFGSVSAEQEDLSAAPTLNSKENQINELLINTMV